MKKIVAIICVICTMLSILTGCGVNRKNLYDPENKDILLADFFFMEPSKDSETISNDAGDTKTQIDSMYEHVKDVEYFDRENLLELESKMIEFFKSKYDVDVTEKLESIETNLFSVKKNNYFLMGYHIPGENKVYVNREIYEDTPEFFAFTWCHEVIHLLGIDYENNTYWGLYEAVTEAVNMELMEWMGEKCNNSSYYKASKVGKQLISANPDLVSNSISDDSFYLEDNINDVLKDANYVEAVPLEGTTIAFQFNAYLVCLIEFTELYQQGGEVFDFVIQEITTAYCRRFNLTEEQIEYAKKNWLIIDFDHTTIECREGYLEVTR